MSPYSLLCTTANTHGSLTLSSSLTFSSVGHVVSTKWGKRVSGFITDPHGWLTIQPTTSLAIVHNDVPPALARQVRRDGEYIIIYILWYIITYICLRVQQGQPVIHMSGLSAQLDMWNAYLLHIWEHANTGIRNAEACLVRPCVDICHIQWCIWIYVCKGHDWAHICLTYVRGWTCPTLLIQPGDGPTRSGQVTLRWVNPNPNPNWYHDGNFTYNFRFLFQDHPYDGWLGWGIICYI
jgi:hypothetical protein